MSEVLGGGVVEALDDDEQLGLIFQGVLDLLEYKDAVQVDKVPLEVRPLVDELYHVLYDAFHLQELVDKVADVRVRLQHADPQVELLEHRDDIPELGNDRGSTILGVLELELSALHLLLEPI